MCKVAAPFGVMLPPPAPADNGISVRRPPWPVLFVAWIAGLLLLAPDAILPIKQAIAPVLFTMLAFLVWPLQLIAWLAGVPR